MSSDDGIYMGCFPTAEGSREYRVIHATAIENCDDSPDFPKEMTDAYRVLYYGQPTTKVFTLAEEAWDTARKMYEDITYDYGVCEYGIQRIDYDRPLPKMTPHEADEFLSKYWAQRTKEKQTEI